MIFLLFFSFLAGLATVLSPCVLPLLPAILSAGTAKGRSRPLGITLGLVFSFTVFTLTLGTLVQATGVSPNLLRYAAIAIMAFFGCVMLFPALGNWFAEKTSNIAAIGVKIQSQTASNSGFWSGFVLGAALGLVWTPCAGPILGAVITLAASQALSLELFFITLAYAAGSGVLLFLIMLGGNRALVSSRFLARYTEEIRKGFGLLMIATAAALLFHFDTSLQQFTLNYFPSIDIENNSLVNRELKKLQGEKSISKLSPFPGASNWINGPAIGPEALKGKAVLIDFWTYSCINCIRTFPYLKKWYQEYSPKGFVIIGVHTPEFAFEKEYSNVTEAVKRFGIPYPVVLDNEYAIWNSYGNHYWPAHYLFDQKGNVVEVHHGEGAYIETENAIRGLLGLPPLASGFQEVPRTLPLTPETYLGYRRAEAYTSDTPIHQDLPFEYTFKDPLGRNRVGLRGKWTIRDEYIISEGESASLFLNFEASRVYLVMEAQQASPIKVYLDDKPLDASLYTEDMDSNGSIQVQMARKYDVVNLHMKPGEHILKLDVPQGVKLFAFTFGNEP